MTEIKPLPLRFVDVKRKIAETYPNFQERVTQSWNDILQQLEKSSQGKKDAGSGVRLSSSM